MARSSGACPGIVIELSHELHTIGMLQGQNSGSLINALPEVMS